MWCLKMQDAHLAETEQTLIPIRPQHQQRQRQNQQFEGGGNVDCCVDRKIGWRYFREPRENPLTASSSSTSQWPTSQWQTSWSSRQRTSSEKWWWFWFPDNRRRVYTGHPFTIHICAVQFVHKRGTHTQRAWLKNYFVISARLKISGVIWCDPCLILGWSLTRFLPWAHHLPHSLSFIWHKNTQHNQYNKSNSENTQYITHISKLPQSTSCSIKNHSGLKICRVAETPAQQLPHSKLAHFDAQLAQIPILTS